MYTFSYWTVTGSTSSYFSRIEGRVVGRPVTYCKKLQEYSNMVDFTVTRLLESGVRIPLRAWIFVCDDVLHCADIGRCDGLIIRSEASYPVCVCVYLCVCVYIFVYVCVFVCIYVCVCVIVFGLETSKKRLRPQLGFSAKRKKTEKRDTHTKFYENLPVSSEFIKGDTHTETGYITHMCRSFLP